MSEYQYYEFSAVDRPLDDDEQAEVRALSTRAEITATSFKNTYEWGDFKGDPQLLMERYYDAHLHVTNWGARRVMLRLPADLLDADAVGEYCVDDQVEAWTADAFTVLDFLSEDEADESDYAAEELLPVIVGVRDELAAGDLRPLYLAWLAAYGLWERNEDAFDREADDDLEPPVPPGLDSLTPAQRALADFLRLDEDLLATAAQASPPPDRPADLSAWVAALPTPEKDELLTRVALGEAGSVRTALLHRFRDDTTRSTPRRTVADLLDATAQLRSDRERRQTAQL